MVSGIFGKHHVTRRSAEIRRIQILHTAVRCSANNKKIEPGGHDHPLQGAPHHGQVQVDGREHSRQIPTSAQTSPPKPNANWNQQQTQHKNGREREKNQDADIRVRRPG